MKNNQTKSKQTADEMQAEKKPEAQGVSLSAETVEAIADAIAAKLTNALPFLLGAQCERLERFFVLHSRLCAADTVRTSERPDTVFRHAIKEAEIVKSEIDKHFQSAND